MTVVDCTAPLNRYTCYGAIEVVAIIIIIIIIIIIRKVISDKHKVLILQWPAAYSEVLAFILRQ